ncbi:MAG: AI-2E family transporter [Desulfovibrionaceae bacterium]|nr:AI-2E family transporter [Desulfovibrionaceae bacterium]
MTILRSRIFYILAVICGAVLFWPYPGTTFMAFCASCLTLPIYRRFKLIALKKQRNLPEKSHFRRKLLRICPMLTYVFSILTAIILPIVAFVMLVAPQASLGLAQLKNMDLTDKLQLLMPENLKSFINTHLPSLKDYPLLQNIADELANNLETFLNTGGDLLNPAELWRRAVALLGGTMSLLWVLCLFILMTILFTLYAPQFKMITRRIFDLPQDLLTRFILSIRRALSAILYGIVFVALIQGFLCGLAFMVAGVQSPAFWGMLAAFVAPIPMVGTMLVWGPLALLQWFTNSHIAAIGLALWGLLVVSNVDSIFRPMFLRQGIPAPFVVLILVMLCGLQTFGPIGLITAPVLLAFAMTLLREGSVAFKKLKNIDK